MLNNLHFPKQISCEMETQWEVERDTFTSTNRTITISKLKIELKFSLFIEFRWILAIGLKLGLFAHGKCY